jgi:hypothetical protein
MAENMFRVVTKSFELVRGQRRRAIQPGPWQPERVLAEKWADYLRATGRYDSIEIESNISGKTPANSDE